MPLDFPTSPALNEIYTFGGRSWIWNGTAWDVYSTVSGNVVTQLNGLTGGVTLAAGSNITLIPSGNTITINSSGGGSGGGICGPYVISFNGLTGTVTGVSSIRGLTGVVGITNGSGIGLSVSGQTMTFSNTGVLNIDGSTGAITNVARTNVTNNFTAIQSFSAGLSAAAFDVNTTAQPLSTASLYFDNVKLGDPNGDLNNICIVIDNTSGIIDYIGAHTFNGSVNFSNSTVTGPLVNSINGKTGAINLVAGSGISLGVSGNTFTITSTAASSTSGFTTSIDFSATINYLQLRVYGTGSTSGTSLSIFNTETINVCNISTTQTTNAITIDNIVNFDPSYDGSSGWIVDITAKPPFGSSKTAEQLFSETWSAMGVTWTSGVTQFADSWTNFTNIEIIDKQATYVVKGITGQSWVTADSFITCKVMGLTSADHSAEDAIVEGINFEINNINPGVGFDIMGYAPEGTYGKYTVKCLGE